MTKPEPLPSIHSREAQHVLYDRLSPAQLVQESPYGRIEKKGRTWRLTQVRPDVAMKLRRLFPSVSSRESGVISLPASIPGFWTEFNWFLKLYPLAVDEVDRPTLERLIAKELMHADAVHQFQIHTDVPPLSDLPLLLPLRSYQRKAVEAVTLRKRLLIADDVGLGKTAVAIASIVREKETPVLFVTMTQLFEQTVLEFAKFTPTVRITPKGMLRAVGDHSSDSEGITIHAIESLAPYELPPADVYVMRYSCLRGWIDVFAQKIFRFVVFDECQELRRRGTAKYKAAQTVARHSAYCIGLTATPIYNYGDEIYNVLNLLNPMCLGRFRDFVEEWGTMTRYHKLIVEQPDALGAMLHEHLLMIRRTKTEVGLELPEVQIVAEQVDHDVKRFNASLGEILELAKKTLFGFTSEDRMTSSGMLDMRLRHATGVSKAHYVAARTRIILESGQPVVLVGWHRDTYDIWRKVLADYNPVLITGSESPHQKEANKQAFIRGDTRLLILSLRSGEGMDGLQNASSIVVFGELDWSPQIHHQVIGRLHRFGQQDSVLALFLVSREGTDPAIASILDLKSEQAFKILNPDMPYHPELDSHGGRKRLEDIAHDMLVKYKVDLEQARAEFEIKEPQGYWTVLAAIESFVWDRSPDEKRYQERIFTWLVDLGMEVEREVTVNEGIIDMLTTDGVGIEVKLASIPSAALIRQIRGYIQDERIRALIVITPEPNALPERLYGKRITGVSPRSAATLSTR